MALVGCLPISPERHEGIVVSLDCMLDGRPVGRLDAEARALPVGGDCPSH